ncbi:Por secretion system C-terminal sorting domain-containing protein [Aquiflexum balticum DSM 16537]|uniref:Por secretion system C-terminal sorting domain-containing protein n=1 Tax=Aquiflexum balticum DSM 16537 TaxID=758820 RepID=A0A1W2H9N6_9BACT|nr:alpha-amylase family glycosyl hydrolase [Aquiflexum balticum]SMD45587.1 Por secretion system C-terminal sorting domain-containing protein [Aquiflexum balticum DSM 16537]
MLKKILITLTFLTSAATLLFGQVTTAPSFPRADQNIKITYDASKGTTGLQGVNQVYIHIGAVIAGPTSTAWAIVPTQWGTDDPIAKMTKVEGESNIWEWELNPNDFFSPQAGQTIYRLGMVFRNIDGTKEGKTATNQDFFVDLSQGFQVTFTNPNTSSILLEVGESQDISIVSSEVANLSLSVNGTQVSSAQNVELLNYTFQATSEGAFAVEAKAEKNGEEDTSQLTITVVGPSPKLPLPQGVVKGINYISDTEVVFVLEAPLKKNAFLIGDFNDWLVLPEFQMNQTLDGEFFWYRLSDLTPGQEYIFQYLVDGSIRIGDPYADKISDPFHDNEIIQQNRYPGLRPYPQGKTEFQASFLQTAQEEYQWQHTEYNKPAIEELVVYELLVRDFDDRRTFNAVTERLDYLKDLGINAIELMPIKEFEGNLSWGYNPSFFFAVDKFYGPKNDLKKLIDEAHKRDMVIILDMVLNHAFGQNPHVRLYNDGDYGAPTEDNPWLNRVAKHPFNVGYDFNHESAYTKAFVDSVNNYWLTEYKVDGYRFDLSKGFTQVNSGDNVALWGQRDPSRIAIWKNIFDQIKENHPDTYVILEHFADNTEERELADYGLMFWGNLNFDFREMAKGGSRNFDWGYYQTRGWSKNTLMSYMESHDEERTMWESLTWGATSPINIRKLSNAVNRNQLLATFFFAIPGPKMMWQFEEFGYDLELNNDRLGIKPTKWEYLDDPERIRLFNLYKAMISLKENHKAFNSPDNAILNLSQPLKSIRLIDGDFQVVLHGNFGLTDVNNANLSFPNPGVWYNYFTGEEVNVTGNSKTFRLRANQFLLFTNQKLELPEGEILEDPILSIGPENIDLSDFKLYPVPSNDILKIAVPEAVNQFNFKILNAAGVVLKEGRYFGADNNLQVDIREFTAGIYIFEISDNRKVLRKRFIKQ